MSPNPIRPDVPLTVTLAGGGIDPSATLTFVRDTDQTAVVPTAVRRLRHDRVEVDLQLAPFMTGTYSITARDPDGGETTSQAVFEALGKSGPEVIATPYSSGGFAAAYVADAAMTDNGSGVVLAIGATASAAGQAARFVRLDGATYLAEETVNDPPIGSGAVRFSPTVAWNEKDKTWGLASVNSTTSVDDAYFRIVRENDLSDVVVDLPLASSARISRLDVAADPVDGGYIVVWDEDDLSANSIARLWGARVQPDGTLAPGSPRLLLEDTVSFIHAPAIVRQADDTLVIGYATAPPSGLALGYRVMVVDDALSLLHPSLVVASSATWKAVYPPYLAAQPNGTVIVAFEYIRQDDLTNTQYVPLTELGVITPPAAVDLSGTSSHPFGIAGTIAWSPDREEFIAPIVVFVNDIEVRFRRIRANGTIVNDDVHVKYEGLYGAVFAGKEPGAVGVTFCHDGVYDDRVFLGGPTTNILAFPFR